MAVAVDHTGASSLQIRLVARRSSRVTESAQEPARFDVRSAECAALMKDHGVITVACAADSTYATPLAVMIRSVLASAEPERSIRLFILDAGLTSADKIRLMSSWRSSRLEVSWLNVDLTRLAGLPLWGRMSAVTYARLLMSERLPESVKRVIWLDCDLI